MLRASYLHSQTKTLHERQSQRAHHAQPHDGPPSINNLLIRQGRTRIPDQMPNAVQAVKSKRKGDEHLGQDFGEDGPSGEACCQGSALEVPAEHWGDEVCGTKEVDAAAEGGAGDAIEGRGVPCYLRSVDAEMGGDLCVSGLVVCGSGKSERSRTHGSVEALARKNLFAGAL
jgi:hypothetical protein